MHHNNVQDHHTTITKASVEIAHPAPFQINALRNLWKDTFGDSDDFLDLFFETAFSSGRCMCATLNGSVVAALYWFNCKFDKKPIAYIYAVATDKNHRGKGICNALMFETHKHLKENGYIGAILSPASDHLFKFYGKMGYQTCAYHNELTYQEDTLYALEEKDISLQRISKEKFSMLRRQFLPKDAVLQENENLDFLEKQAEFFVGKNFLLTAHKEGSHLHGIEFLGDTSMIPNILQSLHCTSGVFHTIGNETPLAMYLPFHDADSIPSYIGFIFD